MASLAHGLFIPAIFNGLFLAIMTKTGIDVSPAGIGVIIFDFLQPYVNEQNVTIFRYSEIILFFLPWVSFVIIVIRFGLKGLIAYGAIIVISYFLILSYWS